MSREVLINAGAGEFRVAVVENSRLQDFSLERTIGLEDGPVKKSGRSGHSLIGNIILGRVQRVLPGMQAAFVDIGREKAGFLGAREARCLAGLPGFEQMPKISDCVHEGEEVLVQVVKDEIGDKGARLSANVTIPGRLAVLVPNSPGVALSRRIADDAERERLLNVGEEMVREANGELIHGAGYILRTAAIGATVQDLREDAERLASAWRPVLAKRQGARSPATLYHDLDPVERIFRDKVKGETSRVLIDDEQTAEAARTYCRRAMPEAEGLIEIYKGQGPIFDLYDLEDEIDLLLQPRVPLPSGGWITVEGTEALTAVDVNSGRFTAATGLEETSYQVNLEAADEIGRQVRLRGIGGLIVVDFIHMSEPANIQKVLDVLSTSISRDHTPTQISGMSEFGLVEITRKRIREPLAKLMSEYCRCCSGQGRRRTPDSMALEVLRRIERQAAAAPGKPINVRASREIVDWLEFHNDEIMQALARRGASRVKIEYHEGFARDGFDVGTAA